MIKTPDGGFFVDDSQVTVDYEKNSLSIISDGGAPDITADGGTFNADAVLQGTDNLSITVPDAGESAIVGVTPESVTIAHNTNIDADSSVRVTADGVELKADTTIVQVNSTGVNMGGSAISGVHSLAGNGSTPISFENEMDMNSHKITGLLNPTQDQDAATKGYVDSQKQQITHITDATDDDIVAQFNALLSAMQSAGLMA